MTMRSSVVARTYEGKSYKQAKKRCFQIEFGVQGSKKIGLVPLWEVPSIEFNFNFKRHPKNRAILVRGRPRGPSKKVPQNRSPKKQPSKNAVQKKFRGSKKRRPKQQSKKTAENHSKKLYCTPKVDSKKTVVQKNKNEKICY